MNLPAEARFPTAPSHQHWTGLAGSAGALALLAAAAAHDGVTLLVARSGHQARVWRNDLRLLRPGDLPVLLFPDLEILPYDPFSPHPDIAAERLATLTDVGGLSRGIVVVAIDTLLQRLAPRSWVLGRSLDLAVGQRLDLDAFRTRLGAAGYGPVEQVWQRGQFAVRGAVVDVFPAGSDEPLRLELFDDEVESIRTFDPESQRSTGRLERFRTLPAREYPAGESDFEAFRSAFRYRFAVDMREVPLYQDLRSGRHPQGLEQYLPLFFEQTESLLDYLPGTPVVARQRGVRRAADAFMRQVEERWEQRRHDITRPLLDPKELWHLPETLFARLDERAGVTLEPERPDADATDFATRSPPQLSLHERGGSAEREVQSFLAEFPGRILVAADTAGRREVIEDALRAIGQAPARADGFAAFRASDERLMIAVLPIDDGFIAGETFAILTEAQLYDGRARQRSVRERSERDPESIIRNLSDLALDAPVVHEDHGVGRYRGLETLEIDQRPAEFLALEYADGDRLYVPVSSLHLVSRYTGSAPEDAPLHALGGNRWQKIRRKAAERVRDVAAELLDLYARRQARAGHAFDVDARLYTEFCAGFPYEETTDQLAAIEAVIDDLEAEQPMDRLVCGDVGFGKTEVALRAAFVAVQGGRQVAILVPTTLLARQHFNTFSDRFADWPVRVELLSRLKGDAHATGVIRDLAAGTVDIVIGTHRLLQKDIRFDRLGLVIVDEEHRFGVRHKERLRQLRAEVDLLTLTATPIPRTLNMAMSGIRDLSIIATPPARRSAVRTLITRWDPGVLREALQREIQRGGQVYFLHNEVRTIERIAREVREWLPDARVAVAHGQMGERELEPVMLDFYRRRTHVLVCTTIIESGLDVPSANTIVINRADKFGLAQLHQLRGRVGRSHHQAYAYLVVPEQRSLTADARKRLDAIAELEDLGAGFMLATHDLEIRGAGELLGDAQSGQIREVGFALYSEMLERAIRDLREGREPDPERALHHAVDVELHLAALIPEDYLADVNARLTLYKRIAGAPDEDALRELQVEMIDRFGLLPPPVKNLFEIARLRLLADRIGVTRLDLGEGGGRVEFSEEAAADPEALIEMMQAEPERFRLEGPRRLRFLVGEPEPAGRLQLAARVLERLQPARASA